VRPPGSTFAPREYNRFYLCSTRVQLMILMLNTSLTNGAYVQHEHNIWYTAWLELLVVLKYT
jgi:hypothetical protein